MRNQDIVRVLCGWRLTTAEILYRLPDHPHVLQSFVWQQLDQAPAFPQLKRFLAYWRRHIEGPLHSVRVGQSKLLDAGELKAAAHMRHLH